MMAFLRGSVFVCPYDNLELVAGCAIFELVAGMDMLKYVEARLNRR